MFGRKTKTSIPAVPAPAQPLVGDIVIHTMPREFYGREASLLATPPSTPLRTGDVVPKHIDGPNPETPKGVEGPQRLEGPKKPLPPPKKRSKLTILVVVIFVLLIVGTAAYGAYRMIQVANTNAQRAQEEVDRLKAEEEARARAAEEQKARDDAAAQAAAAAAAATPVPATDTDSDGLTDIEELLYGTNFRDPDSDKDTYLDGNEVFHRYHPLGLAPATLLDTGAVKVFADADYPYTMYYPSTWSTALTRDTLGVAFRSARQATINVTWETKTDDATLDAYLAARVTEAERTKMKDILTKEGYYGKTSADDRTAYLNMGSAVAILTYDLGNRAQIEYLQTFQMMVNSFTLVSR